MRFFSLLDLQYTMVLIFLGLIALVLLLVAFGEEAYLGRKTEEKTEEYPGGIQVQNRPIPLILIFVYVGLAIWAAVYVIMVGMKGIPF